MAAPAAGEFGAMQAGEGRPKSKNERANWLFCLPQQRSSKSGVTCKRENIYLFAGDSKMPTAYIICAEIDADENVAIGLYASDWFNCGINENSQRYPSADEALVAAQHAYRGPDIGGVGCRVWAKQAA